MQIPILLALFIILYLILCLKRLDIAVSIILFALPSYLIRFKIFGIPFTLLELMILTAFIIWLIRNWKNIFNNLRQKIQLFKNRNWKFLPNRQAGKIENQKSKINNYPFGIEIILVLIISYIAVAIAGFSNEALGIWKAYFFEPILLYILIVNVSSNNVLPKDALISTSENNSIQLNKILWPLCLSAFFVSCFAIYQKFTGSFIINPLWAAEATRRVTSVFDYPNAVGLFLGPIVLLLIGWEINRIKNYAMPAGRQELRIKDINLFYIENAFIIFTIIFSLIAVYFARSEGAIVGVAAGLFIFGILAGKKIRWITFGIATIVLLVIIFTPLKIYAYEKITLTDLSGEIRKQQWRETWQMLNDGKIISGTGLSNYQTEIKPYHQEGIYFNKDNDPDFYRKIRIFDEKYKSERWQPVEIYMYPHNILLNFWAELGFFGMLIFLWIIIKYFIISASFLKNKYNIQNTKYIILGLIGAMTAMVVHGLVDVPYFKNDLSCLFWIFIAILSLIQINYKTISKKQE